MLVRRKLRKFIKYDKVTGVIETECKLTLQTVGFARIEIDNVSYRLVEVLYILVHGEIPTLATVVQVNKKARLDFRLCNLELDYTKRDKAIKEKGVVARRELRQLKKQDEINHDKFMKDRRYDFS